MFVELTDEAMNMEVMSEVQQDTGNKDDHRPDRIAHCHGAHIACSLFPDAFCPGSLFTESLFTKSRRNI